MPPLIKLYSDAKYVTPYLGEIGIVDAGTELETTIYLRNEGNGTLLSPKVEITPDSNQPLPAILSGESPKNLAPNQAWSIILHWRVDPKEKYGIRKATLKVTGRFID
jgi:hypothetical protein